MTKEQELKNLIPKIKSQVKQWRGKISTDVQNQIFEVINEMITAQDKIAELEKDREELLQRTECTVESFNMEAHNLEQQAKGVNAYADNLKVLPWLAVDGVDARTAIVLAQLSAKALKEGK